MTTNWLQLLRDWWSAPKLCDFSPGVRSNSGGPDNPRADAYVSVISLNGMEWRLSAKEALDTAKQIHWMLR